MDNAKYTDLLSKLSIEELLELAQAIQAEVGHQHAPPKSIFSELEALAKKAGISSKELDFLT